MAPAWPFGASTPPMADWPSSDARAAVPMTFEPCEKKYRRVMFCLSSSNKFIVEYSSFDFQSASGRAAALRVTTLRHRDQNLFQTCVPHGCACTLASNTIKVISYPVAEVVRLLKGHDSERSVRRGKTEHYSLCVPPRPLHSIHSTAVMK